MKLREIAAKIQAHLDRFAADPGINAKRPEKGGMIYYDRPDAVVADGNNIHVTYHAARGYRILTEVEARGYLAWLDAGNVGRHYEWQEQGK